MQWLSCKDPPHVVNVTRAACNELVDDQILNRRKMHMDLFQQHRDRSSDSIALIGAEREDQIHPDPGHVVQQGENVGPSDEILDRVDGRP